ncbi:MAG: GNAT family N-acetyltransferase [Candidatus Levybacteria bacterium]|nr:GNAT family N-acetyltransferase [Candidatus Levybacteria bacterium]
MIRKAISVDVQAIHSLINLAAIQGKVLPRSKNEIKEIIDSFFVWVEDGKVIGCCSLEIYSKKLAEVRSLIVLPRYQNKGIGTKLLKACLDRAKHENVYELLAVTERDHLFETLGFQKCLNNQWPMFIRI